MENGKKNPFLRTQLTPIEWSYVIFVLLLAVIAFCLFLPRIENFFIHGDQDNLVPFSMGERLFAAARAPKYFHKIHGAGRNDTYIVGGEEYFSTILSFVIGH